LPATGPTLRYLEELHTLALEQADNLQPTMDRIMDSSPADSSTDKDFKHILRSVRSDDRRQLWSRTQLACLNMAVNVGDHVRSLAPAAVTAVGRHPELRALQSGQGRH
jgi:hypothetical protein